MKTMMTPKVEKTKPNFGTDAQNAPDNMKSAVSKLLLKNQPQSTLPFF